MWWEEFKTRITVTFAIIDRNEYMQVYSNLEKLPIINRNIKADSLEVARTNIEIELEKLPITLTCGTDLSINSNSVNINLQDDET